LKDHKDYLNNHLEIFFLSLTAVGAGKAVDAGKGVDGGIDVAAGKAVDAGKGVDGGIGESEVIITFSSVEGPHAVNNNMVRTINLLM